MKCLKQNTCYFSTVKLGDKELFGHPKIVPYPYEVNYQISHGKWFLNTNLFLMKTFLITKLVNFAQVGIFSALNLPEKSY
jgi:hypothetical protein